MDRDNLVRMANRIATFFEAMPSQDEAQEGVRNHLQKFWAPAMRAALIAEVESGREIDLHPLVRATVLRFGVALSARSS